jgi:WD40 repeat protein
MATTVINTIVSTKELHFQPGGVPASFEVTVVNGSDRFASFQLELVAAGAAADRNGDWYSISPTASSKKPPGAATRFQVSILDTPVPGFVGMMNIRVRVFSMELPDETREILRLVVERGTGLIALQLELPVKQFQINPGSRIEVPVRVYNPGQLLSNALLTEKAIDPRWLPLSTERRLQVPPGKSVETTFTYQPPFGAVAPSQAYPFTLEATHNNGPASRVSGTLEVMPMGFVEFTATPKQRVIPSKLQWKFWQSPPVTYNLEAKNASNLPQEATLELAGENSPECDLTLVPETSAIAPEETVEFLLTARKKRPWFGRHRKLLLELTGIWSDRRVDTRNERHTLELVVKPVLPLWLQLLGGLFLLYLLWWLSWLNPRNPFFGHDEPVNTVKFNGVGERLISGSNDQTIIEWNISGFFNPIVNPELRKFPNKGNRLWRRVTHPFQNRTNCQSPGCTDLVAEKAVRVLQYRPVNNNWVATGLENGEIHLWNLTENRPDPLQSFVYQKDDRVFALEFTQDSRALFSGHGSGAVLQWDLKEGERPDSTLGARAPNLKQFNFAVYALKFVGNDDRTLAVAGQLNQLVLWNWRENTEAVVPYREGGKDDYINSLDTAEFNPHLLATADTQGYITLWNMQPCLNGGADCQRIEQWQDGHNGQPVRSVALSENGCYLVSGGDDGRVMLWPLNIDGSRAGPQGEPIMGAKNKNFNSVDIKEVDDHLAIAAGSDDYQEVRVEFHSRLPNLGCDLP